jgi:riboflavin kinase/FMN adenylyltransferase
MQVIRGLKIPPALKGAVVTIGNFDGVHRGHRYVLKRLTSLAGAEKTKALLITFDPHPKMIIHPDIRPFYLLTTLKEKLALLAATGIDGVVVVKFTPAYALTTAEEFVTDFLVEKLAIRRIIIGHDYSFGRGKEGNEKLLTELGARLGFAVEVLDPFGEEGTIVSSTRIREAILQGDMETAANLLGRPYTLSGPVIHGKSKGAGLGFSTANIRPNKILLPPDGVYVVRVGSGGSTLGGVMSIGTNPTFGSGKRTFEVHMFDFNDDIYGKEIEVAFLTRLREQRVFPSVPDLVRQIAQDVAQAREIWEDRGAFGEERLSGGGSKPPR